MWGSRIFTLYSKALPLDVACRVWDVFCRDGEEFLFRTALGLLHRYQDALQGMDFIQMAQLLTRLPDLVPGEQLFQHIAAVHMTCRAGKWPQVRTDRDGRTDGRGMAVTRFYFVSCDLRFGLRVWERLSVFIICMRVFYGGLAT